MYLKVPFQVLPNAPLADKSKGNIASYRKPQIFSCIFRQHFHFKYNIIIGKNRWHLLNNFLEFNGPLKI